MPYDLLERVIQDSVSSVATQNLNARISNVAFQLNGRLILMQVYVERKNGFVTSKDNRYGTSPTSYRVQVRFPFGLTADLNGQELSLPGGNFKDTLAPYISSQKVSDDVQRDTTAELLVLGTGVSKTLHEGKIVLSCHGEEQLSFPIDETMGLGYEVVPMAGPEYKHLSDYNLRLKYHGLYPLFYSSPFQERIGLLRFHSEYRGYTDLQTNVHESKHSEVELRKTTYRTTLEVHDAALSSTKLGAEWLAATSATAEQYVLDLTLINGMQFFTESGLPLIRLRDYQLKLLAQCMEFIHRLANKTAAHRAGRVGMGVGAGKTFITYALLQHIKHSITVGALSLPPPYCMAPNKAVADVTATTINRQGVQTASRAFLVEGAHQLPSDEVLAIYNRLSGTALEVAHSVEHYLQEQLQTEILQFCEEKQLYPLKMLNLLYGKVGAGDYSQSIDPKRLFLLVQAQKTMVKMTGMLSIDSLRSILEQLQTIQKSIMEDRRAHGERSFFSGQRLDPRFTPGDINIAVDINFNQRVPCPKSYEFDYISPAQKRRWFPDNCVNLTELTPDGLLVLFQVRGKGNLRTIRDSLVRLAFFKNPEAALLLANSGGLGNTYDDAAMRGQIERLAPDAHSALQEMLRKKPLTLKDHYTLYMYLKEIFSTIPEAIFIKNFAAFDGHTTQIAFINDGLHDSLNLVNHLSTKLSTMLESLPKIAEDDQIALAHFGVKPNMTIIDAINHIAGPMALRMTGATPQGSARQQLALTHTPIFTPEGFTAYLESLVTYIGKPAYDVHKERSLYTLAASSTCVTKAQVKSRIHEVLHAIMIADEVHKDEFKFLFDETNPLHQRLNALTQDYFGTPFKALLPHRIGMSGTFNEVAEEAFPGDELYSLSTQSMIQQGLVKQICVESNALESLNKNDFAKKVVIDYFMNHFLVSHSLTTDKPVIIDLFAASKGLLFSKTTDPELNARISYYFNLLLKTVPSSAEEHADQEELWENIELLRHSRRELIENKIRGRRPLSSSEQAVIQVYNRQAGNPAIAVNEHGHIQAAPPRSLTTIPLRTRLAELQREAFLDHCFALYLQYALSKSNTPKELSDLVGLQNRRYQEGRRLFSLATPHELLVSIASVDPTSMNEANILAFVQERIDEPLCSQLVTLIFGAKNNVDRFKHGLQNLAQMMPLDSLITDDRKTFESGKVFAMLGSVAVRTGYSHEPVGIVVDTPTPLAAVQIINQWMNRSHRLTTEGLQGFYSALNDLIAHTLSYDEKNQAGGRALRTPHGQVRYVEYLSKIHQTLQHETRPALQLFRVETSFSDIFIPDEEKAKEARASINFNRALIPMLAAVPEGLSYEDFIKRARRHFRKELSNPQTDTQCRRYLEERLPLAWTIKCAPETALAYFAATDEAVLQDYRTSLAEIMAEPEEVEAWQNIDLQLTRLLRALQEKTAELIQKGRSEKSYQDVKKKAEALMTSLQQAQRHFQQEPHDLQQLRTDCHLAIHDARNEFSHHRSVWGQLYPSLKIILGLLALVTVLPAICTVFGSKHGYVGTFFKNQPTNALEKLQDFETGLSTIETIMP